MKKTVSLLLVLVMLLCLCACSKNDTQNTDPSTNSGQATPTACSHSWNEATCIAPKTCSVCGATEGTALGHSFENFVDGKHCTRCYDREDWLGGIWDLTGLSEGYQFEKIDLQFWGYAGLGFTTSEGWYAYQTSYNEEGTSEDITVSGNTVTVEFSNDGKSGTMVLQRTGMNELTVTSMTGDLFTDDITSAINSVGKFTKTFYVNGEVSE